MAAGARPTRAEVLLGRLARNLAVVRQAAGGACVLAVVKADAYGHGVVPIARTLERLGVEGFAVALAEEGIELREAGVRAPILVLGGAYGRAHPDVLGARLTPVVYEERDLLAFAALGGREGRGRRGPVAVHVKIDTGMSRLGVPVDSLEPFLDVCGAQPGIRIEGVMTHLASAESDPEFTREQLRRFDRAIAQIRAAGHRPSMIHAANSAGLLGYAEARYTHVRPGILLYGVSPASGLLDSAKLSALMRLRTEVVALRTVPAGGQVGYGGTFVARRPTRIATIPAGYADGLFRVLGNRGEALVRGRRAPIVGQVSMDMATLDVTDVSGAAVGDEVVLLGEQGPEAILAADIAARIGTIGYEILTAVSRRVPRVHIEGTSP